MSQKKFHGCAKSVSDGVILVHNNCIKSDACQKIVMPSFTQNHPCALTDEYENNPSICFTCHASWRGPAASLV